MGKGRHPVMPDGLAEALAEECAKGGEVAKADFPLGGVDVDVDLARGEVDPDKVGKGSLFLQEIIATGFPDAL